MTLAVKAGLRPDTPYMTYEKKVDNHIYQGDFI